MPETPARPLGVALIGYAFMGRAHSQAWRTVGAAFDVPPIARRVIVGRDEQGVAEARAQLDEANRQGLLQPGDYVVLTAFGGGLSTAACVIRW